MMKTEPIVNSQRRKRYSKRARKTNNGERADKMKMKNFNKDTGDLESNLTKANIKAMAKEKVEQTKSNTTIVGMSYKDKPSKHDGLNREDLKPSARQRDSVFTHIVKLSTTNTSRPSPAQDQVRQEDLNLNFKHNLDTMQNPSSNHTAHDQAGNEDVNLNAKKKLGQMMTDDSGAGELTDVYDALGDLKKPQANRAPLDFEKSPVLFYNPAGGWGKTVLGPLRMPKPKTGTIFKGNLFSANVTGQLRQELGLQGPDEAPLIDVGGREATQLREVKGILVPGAGGSTGVMGGDAEIRRGTYVAYKVTTSGGKTPGHQDDTLPRRPPTTFDDVMKEPPPSGMQPPLDPEPTRRSMNDGHLRPTQNASAPPYVSPGHEARGVLQAVGVVQAERITRVAAGWRMGRCGDLETQLPTWVSPLYRPYGIGGPYGPHGPFYNCPQDPVDVIGRQKVKDALGVKDAAPQKCLRERFKAMFTTKKGASTKGDVVLVDLTTGTSAPQRKPVAVAVRKGKQGDFLLLR